MWVRGDAGENQKDQGEQEKKSSVLSKPPGRRAMEKRELSAFHVTLDSAYFLPSFFYLLPCKATLKVILTTLDGTDGSAAVDA